MGIRNCLTTPWRQLNPTPQIKRFLRQCRRRSRSSQSNGTTIVLESVNGNRNENPNMNTTNGNANESRSVISSANVRFELPSGEELNGEERAWHYILRYVWQSNFNNVIVENQLEEGSRRVLDVCCGTGDWTLDLARTYAASSFVGSDAISRNQWDNNLNNVVFLDANPEHLPFVEEFEFVHIRCHTTDYTKASWEHTILPILLRALKPEGFLEICVTDVTLYNGNGTATEKIMNAYQAYSHAKSGKSSTLPRELQGMLKSLSGLTDVRSEHKDVPFGKWGDQSEIGEANANIWIKRWRNIPQLASILGISNDTYLTQLSNVVPTETTNNNTSLRNFRLTARKIARRTDDRS